MSLLISFHIDLQNVRNIWERHDIDFRVLEMCEYV